MESDTRPCSQLARRPQPLPELRTRLQCTRLWPLPRSVHCLCSFRAAAPHPFCPKASFTGTEAIPTKFALHSHPHLVLSKLEITTRLRSTHLVHCPPSDALKSSTSTVSSFGASLGITTPLVLLSLSGFSGSSSSTSVSETRCTLNRFLPFWLVPSGIKKLSLFACRC